MYSIKNEWCGNNHLAIYFEDGNVKELIGRCNDRLKARHIIDGHAKQKSREKC